MIPTWAMGILFFAFGYMADSAIPSLLELFNVFINRLKAVFGAGDKNITPPNPPVENV
jgi:hypothetical protein